MCPRGWCGGVRTVRSARGRCLGEDKGVLWAVHFRAELLGSGPKVVEDERRPTVGGNWDIVGQIGAF